MTNHKLDITGKEATHIRAIVWTISWLVNSVVNLEPTQKADQCLMDFEERFLHLDEDDKPEWDS